METDILIVGGGLSGLALADQLQRQGRDWILIEARDRLGGRILSPNINGANFDLGPAWFWPGQPRIEKLLRRFNLEAFGQYSQGGTVYQDQLGAVQTYNGFSSMAGSLRVAGGMGALVDALASELPDDKILLNTPLSTVVQAEDGIAAHAGTASISTNQVVLAVPPRVVTDIVDFEPALPKEAHIAMENIPTWMAGQAKILAVYDKAHWRDAGLSGDGISQRGPMIEIHDASPINSGPYALFGFVGFPPDARAEHPEQVLEMVREQLVAMFGENMGNPISLQMLDWAQEPETATKLDQDGPRFHPSYGIPQSLSNIWSGKILFGSTETASGYGGFLEGALEAADRVASSSVKQEQRELADVNWIA